MGRWISIIICRGSQHHHFYETDLQLFVHRKQATGCVMETKLRYAFGTSAYSSHLLVLFSSVPKLLFNNKFHSCSIVQYYPDWRIAVMRSKRCSGYSN